LIEISTKYILHPLLYKLIKFYKNAHAVKFIHSFHYIKHCVFKLCQIRKTEPILNHQFGANIIICLIYFFTKVIRFNNSSTSRLSLCNW
jgi:hypothetical protein